MDDTGDITQDGEQDVDEEISIASALEEDTQRWEDNGEDDFADVAGEKCIGQLELRYRGERAKSGKGRKRTYEAVKGMMADG